MANVNSVKFSPDGNWIASGGTEGSVIIWDIRMSKEFIQFPAACKYYSFSYIFAS